MKTSALNHARRVITLMLLALFFAQFACAGIPDAYAPIVVSPPFSFTERVVDLTTGFQKARKEGRPLVIYLGAKDCPPCRFYDQFLEENKAALLPVTQQLVLVDIRTWIKGPELTFKVEDRSMNLREFREMIGDRTKGGVRYPHWWVISSNGKLVRTGKSSDTFNSVDEHISFLLSASKKIDKAQ